MKHFLFLCLYFVFGCASDSEKTEPKTYSNDTNRAFEMIERGGSYYLKKAPEQTTPAPQIQTRTQTHSIPEKRRTVKPTLAPVEETPVTTTTTTTTVEPKHKTKKTDERLIEINQNLAFYCMKHRKDARFGGDEATCMKFVNKTMSDCQSVHHIVNSKLLTCIKTQLRKR